MINVEAHRLDRLAELPLVDGARAVDVPCTEQVDYAIGRASQGVLKRPLQVLGLVDLPATVLVKRVETLAQIRFFVLTLLAVTDESAELVKVELAVVVRVRRVALQGVVAHAILKLLLARASHVISFQRLGGREVPGRQRRRACRGSHQLRIRAPRAQTRRVAGSVAWPNRVQETI